MKNNCNNPMLTKVMETDLPKVDLLNKPCKKRTFVIKQWRGINKMATDLDKTKNIVEYLERKSLTIDEAENIIDYLERFICSEKTKSSITKIIMGGQ